MKLIKARVKGYRSVLDSGTFDIEQGKTILVGPNEAGKTAILQALQMLNPPEGIGAYDSLRDYPRAKYNEDIVNGGIQSKNFTFVEGEFILEDDEKNEVPEEYKNIKYKFGRHIDNSAWYAIEGGPNQLVFSDIEKDLEKVIELFKKIDEKEKSQTREGKKSVSELEAIIAEIPKDELISVEQAQQIQKLIKNETEIIEVGDKEVERLQNKLEAQLDKPVERKEVLKTCRAMVPKFILFNNYFRIKPILHLQKLKERIENNLLDDTKYDYGNICLLKLLGFTAKELSEAGDTSKFNLNDLTQFSQYKAQLDERDYKLNAATIRLTNAIREVWNPSQDRKDASTLRIKADGQYLKVVVEDELGVEVELDQRSEGFQWLVSFYVVFFAEATDNYKNSILLLDEPAQSLHGLKQAEFRKTISKLSEKNQTIYTTHSPFLVGANELDKVRVVEMTNRKVGTKVNQTLTATDSGAILPLQEALGYDLAQSLFFNKKNLVLEGLTDLWYLEGLSELLKASDKKGIDDKIALLPANSASKVVYYATILHAQNLKIAALLDSDAAGDAAAQQDVLVNTLGNKKIIRTKDVYQGAVTKTEIEDVLRDTLVDIAKEQLSWDVSETAKNQPSRPIVDIFEKEIGNTFSKYKLAKAFLRWTRDHKLDDLREIEIGQAQELVNKINKALE